MASTLHHKDIRLRLRSRARQAVTKTGQLDQSMDKVYKEDIPRHKKTLLELKREFASVVRATDWTTLRIQPLLEHVTALERLLRSPKFSREHARLRKGVAMFHADLVYLRANIKALKEILAAERRSFSSRKKTMRWSPRGQGVDALPADGSGSAGAVAATRRIRMGRSATGASS